jgi:hypothetical protein
MIHLTREQTEPAERHPEGVPVKGDGTTKTFVLVEAEVMQRLQRACQRQQTHDSLVRAIADMEAGRTRSLDESAAYTRSQIGCSPDHSE